MADPSAVTTKQVDFFLRDVEQEIGIQPVEGIYGNTYAIKYAGTSYAAQGFQVDWRDDLERSLIQECHVWSTVRHPNISQFIGLWRRESGKVFPTIVTEKMQYSLRSLMECPEDLLKINLLPVFQCVSLGIRYLHFQTPPIVHCGITPDNILLQLNTCSHCYSVQAVKITNVGVAKVMKLSDCKQKDDLLPFIPPEARNMGNLQCEPSFDVFSFGAVFLCTQRMPGKPGVSGDPDSQLRELLNHLDLIPECLKSVLRLCCNAVPGERPTIAEVSSGFEKVISKQAKENKEIAKLRCSDLADSVYIASGETGVAAEEPMTIPDLYSNMFNKKPDEIALKWKDNGEWQHKTYAEYKDLIYNVAKSFLKLGLKPHHVVGILGYNSVEWFASSIGAVFAGGISTGLYTNDSPDDCHYILKDSKATIVVVENCELLNTILKIRDKLSHLKTIVQYKGELNKKYRDTYTWTEFLELGKDVKASRSMIDIDSIIKKLQPNQCAMLVYTSGTTTYPKGVMLSHDNVTWTTKALMDTIGSDKVEELTKSTVSYLPSTHISGMFLDMFLPIATGGTVYFSSTKGSLSAIMKEVHPTNFFATPRWWERTKDKMKESKMDTVSSEQIKKMLGLDKCKYIFVGADSMNPHILKYFRELKITILEVYGLSETTGPHSTNLKSSDKYGHCGSSINGGHTKIINESKYSESRLLHLNKPPNQVGEVVCRGRNVFMGYLGKEKKTKKNIDDEGWLLTKDIGYKDEDGNLHITCRIDDLIKMGDGMKVAPVEIEETIKAKVDFLSNVMLIGDCRKFLTCLVTLKCVVDPDTGKVKDDLQPQVIEYFKTLGTDCTTASEVTRIKDKAVYNVIQKGIDEYNEIVSLNAALKIKDWKLLSTDFSVHKKELGPALKLRRSMVKKNYAWEIAELYGNESSFIVTNQEQCPLFEPVSVTEDCNYYGQRIKIQDHNVTVNIPKGAIEKDYTVEVKVAASLFGSYVFPKGLSRASPYVWIGANYSFKKPLDIEVEHHAAILKEDYRSNLCVMEICDKKSGESSESQCLVGNSFCTYCTTSKHITFIAKSENIPVEVAVYQFLPHNYKKENNFTLEIVFCCNLEFFRKTIEERYKNAKMIKNEESYSVAVKSGQVLQLSLPTEQVDGWNIQQTGSPKIAANKIIYQTYQGIENIKMEIVRDSYPCFRVTVAHIHQKAQLNPSFGICVQSEDLLTIHVPGETMADTQPKEKEIFRDHIAKLCNTMVDIDNLLPHFAQVNIITLDDLERIKAKPTTKDKVEKLLQYISGPLQTEYVESFHIMLSIMEKHGTQATRELASTMKSHVTADIKATAATPAKRQKVSDQMSASVKPVSTTPPVAQELERRDRKTRTRSNMVVEQSQQTKKKKS
ncbi:uncharacterized protein [Dysidea avara]|uniref:uncharacterized protein isoform X2 n=1 Tax=Dysidea avara TaxID=196820 RepID=UPI0033320605